MTLIRFAARPILVSMFVVGGVNALRNSEEAAARAKPVAAKMTRAIGRVAPQLPVPRDEVTLVRVNAAVQIASALALATGRAPRLSSTVLAASLVPTTLGGHRFWEESDPTTRKNQRLHFAKNVSALGGLMLAAVDTEGKPGVAWRTKHAVGDVRREAKHLRRGAKAQARLAAKSVTS
ncbi:MAG: DoxX family protein [Nocardioides sp.]